MILILMNTKVKLGHVGTKEVNKLGLGANAILNLCRTLHNCKKQWNERLYLQKVKRSAEGGPR